MAKAKKADRQSKTQIKKRGRASKTNRRRSAAPVGKIHAPRDLEDIYIDELLSKKEPASEMEVFPHHLLYNSTREMRKFSYRYGFSVGKEVCRKAGAGGAGTLLRVLGLAGIGRILYTPLDDGAVIRGSAMGEAKGAGYMPMHSYESGIISGYLSASSSRPVFTKETHCVYAGDSFCQFSSREWESGADEASPRLAETIEAVSSSLRNGGGRKADAYLLLSLLPAMREPMLGESGKLMFLFGQRLAANAGTETGIRWIGRMFGLERVAVTRRTSGLSVAIRYNSYNSTAGFLGLSTKAFIGFLSKSFNSPVRLRESRQKSHYTATLSVTGAN